MQSRWHRFCSCHCWGSLAFSKLIVQQPTCASQLLADACSRCKLAIYSSAGLAGTSRMPSRVNAAKRMCAGQQHHTHGCRPRLGCLTRAFSDLSYTCSAQSDQLAGCSSCYSVAAAALLLLPCSFRQCTAAAAGHASAVCVQLIADCSATRIKCKRSQTAL